jgi:hypothetical protein
MPARRLNDAAASASNRKDLDSMEIKVVLSSGEIIRGLKHYRRIARHDLLQAEQFDNPERYRQHAEARRDIYAHLAEVAATHPPPEVAREALRCYQQLPFVTGTPEDSHNDIKGRENALENFFLMIGLEPKIRRQVRSQRSSLPADA